VFSVGQKGPDPEEVRGSREHHRVDLNRSVGAELELRRVADRRERGAVPDAALNTAVVPSDRSQQLQDLAQRVADALPPDVAEEVVLTGSVSRGVADELSDIEMLIVTPNPLELAACFDHARAAGLEELDTWGPQGTPTQRVSGVREGVPLELVWWSRDYAESCVEAIFRGEGLSVADAIANGIALRTSGLLSRWKARLGDYPDEVASAQIEDAALTWSGFAPAGLLTLVRPGEQLARIERMLDDASRVLRIVYALNRVWPPTHKRLGPRVASLAVKPARLAERIEEALSEPDARRALLVMTELQAETVALAPDGPNVNRARSWLAAGTELLSSDLVVEGR
jgi:predicted nucleotidyltransferase